jgi:hypothetical protein
LQQIPQNELSAAMAPQMQFLAAVAKRIRIEGISGLKEESDDHFRGFCR